MSKTAKITGCRAISDAFLHLHQRDGFKILEPPSLLHPSVKTSFVMSAGLVQIENELDSIIQATAGKFTFIQPCFRYFDMEFVGNDSTHSSLFHMPAAFYMGSSQRENILPRLWYFFTHLLQLEPEKLWITYLDDPIFGKDQESYDCWKILGVDETHLIGLSQKHNFWRQTKTGKIAKDGKKCGPHSEVFYERSEVRCQQCEISTALIGSCSCGRFVELSNSLFIENYINEQGELIAADTIFSECVIGVERLAMILQNTVNVHRIAHFSNWHTIIKNDFPQKQSTQYDRAIDIIVDHLSAFIRLVEDGAPEPGRGGQARIMRQLARGAMTQALYYNMDINKLLLLLLSNPLDKHSRYTSINPLIVLEMELCSFIKTLEKGQKKMISLVKDSTLTLEIKETLRKEWGVPVILTDKYYKIQFPNVQN